MNLWIIIFIIGLLTFAIRLSFILLFGVVEVPQALVEPSPGGGHQGEVGLELA